MPWSAPDWIYSHGELPNPPDDNRFESSEVGRTYRNANQIAVEGRRISLI